MSRDEVRELLSRHLHELLHISRRFHWWQLIEQELRAATRGRTFRVHNSLVWTSLLDMRDMGIVDLCSFLEGLTERGGLFDQLADRGAAFPRTPTDRDPADLPGYQRIFRQVFPNCTADKATRTEFRELTQTFREAFDHVTLDRNQNRAHRYERLSRERPYGDVRMLGHQDVMATFELVADTLNALYGLACNSTMAMDNIRPAEPEEVRRLIDEIVLEGPVGDDVRGDWLEHLHSRWDESGADLFNEHSRVWRLRNPKLAATLGERD